MPAHASKTYPSRLICLRQLENSHVRRWHRLFTVGELPTLGERELRLLPTDAAGANVSG